MGRYSVEEGKTLHSTTLDVTCLNTIPSWRKAGNGKLRTRFIFQKIGKSVVIETTETAFADPTSSKRKNQREQTISVRMDLSQTEGLLLLEHLRKLYG